MYHENPRCGQQNRSGTTQDNLLVCGFHNAKALVWNVITSGGGGEIQQETTRVIYTLFSSRMSGPVGAYRDLSCISGHVPIRGVHIGTHAMFICVR